MSISGGEDRGGRGRASKIEGRDLSPEERVKKFQDQMENYVDLVRHNAPTEEIKEAEKELSREMGKDRFEAFKRQLPKQLKAYRGLDAQRTYGQFKLPGRQRIVHDLRGRGERAERHKRGEKADEGRGPRGHSRIQDGRLVKQKEREYANYFADKARLIGQDGAKKADFTRQMDELLSKFEKLIVERFEGDRQVAKKAQQGKPSFLDKTEKQWKDFFSRFAGRILKKRVPTKNIEGFIFRGVIPKGGKGLVISDMTLASGRVERFIRFSIIAEAMARLAKMLPGEKFGKDVLSGNELYYLALAAARGREYKTSPRPTQGLFMGGAAEEKASQDLGIPLSAHLSAKTKHLKGKKGSKIFSPFGRDKEIPDEVPYQFIPWWHWTNLSKPGKFKMTTVAFYIALGVIAILGILAITVKLLK